jgi:hypothetical protein
MAKNTTITQLDAGQVIKRIFDEPNDALRVEIGSGTSFALGITADDGSSITAVPSVSETKSSITNANTGVIVGPVPCIGMKSFELYTNTTSTITGAQVCTLQVSPSDTDNVWISTSTTITPSTTNATVVTSTVNTSIVARRMRVSIAAAITTGSFDIYLLGQST